MVNTQLLDEKIDSSGLKTGYIVETLGISRQAFDRKKKNAYAFRASEIYVICDLLKITDDSEKKAIFFANQVHFLVYMEERK